MPITLTAEAGPFEGRSFTFTGHELFLVGRSKRCHFQLDTPEHRDRYFSRVQFLIEVKPPLCRLHHLGRNPTRVNGQPVRSADLRDGDRIKAGQTVLRVALAPELETTVDYVEPPLPAPPPLPMAALPTATCAACAAPAAGDRLCPACRNLADGQAQFLPGYRLVRELGRGGMGSVVLAVRDTDGAAVAVKTVLPAVRTDSAKVQRFLREADVLRRLSHPHIVAFREVGEAAGRVYFVMDYVRGSDLAAVLKQRGPLPVAEAVGIVGVVLEALAYAHARRFVHRDIKPANILLAQPGPPRPAAAGPLPNWLAPSAPASAVPMLADFGLARVYQASELSGLTLGGEVGGTPNYMPPEQITDFRGVSPAADQYSVAATLYHLLTGKFVHDFERGRGMMSAFVCILNEEPVPIRRRRPELPEGLARVIHRALAREPADRYSDAAAFRQALLPFGG
jgi:serine/threonine-protein kinase